MFHWLHHPLALLVWLLPFSCTKAFNQEACIFDLPNILLLPSAEAFQQVKEDAWRILSCPENQDEETAVAARYALAEVYRHYRQQDSLAYYHEEAKKLASKALPPQHVLRLKLEQQVTRMALRARNTPLVLSQLSIVDSLLRGSTDPSLRLEQYRAWAEYYRNQQEFVHALAQLDEGLRRCAEFGGTIGAERQAYFKALYSSVLKRQGDYLNALKYGQQALEHFLKHHDSTHPDAIAFSVNLGLDHYYIGLDKQAGQYLQQAYQTLVDQKRADRPPADVVLTNWGAVHYDLGDIDDAISCFSKAVAIREQYFGSDHPKTISIRLNLGSMYVQREREEEGLNILADCKKLLQGQENNNALLGKCLSNMGVAFRQLEQYEKARDAYQTALQYYRAAGSGNELSTAVAYRNLAQLLVYEEEFESARSNFQMAYQLYAKELGPSNPETIVVAGMEAEPMYLSGAFAEAKETYQNAFTQLGLDTEKLSKLPEKRLVLDLLQSATQCFWKSYQASGKQRDLENTLKWAETGLAVLDLQRQEVQAETTQAWLTHQYYALYETLLSAQLAMSELEARGNWEQATINTQERAKAKLLEDAIRQAGSSLFVGLSREEAQYLHELKVKLSFLDKQLLIADEGSLRHQLIGQQLFDLRNELEDKERELSQAYTYIGPIIGDNYESGPDQFVGDLSANMACLNYFVGESSIFLSLIQTTGYQVWQIDLPEEFQLQLTRFIEQLNQPPQLDDLNSSAFTQDARGLYQLLLEPALQHISPEVDQLLIVPDGVLHYLPFGLLLDEDSSASEGYQDLPYLLRKYDISYSPSIGTWYLMRHKLTRPGNPLVFAPTFSAVSAEKTLANRRMALGPLHFNQAEAEQITSSLPGQAFLGEKASIDNLLQHLPDGNLLHFATHAKLDPRFPRYSYLAFHGASPDSIDNKLFLSDIYHLDLPVEMVVLSACETGIGKLRQGEGLMSLARGFAYAGAKSVIPSLWAVNDQSTADIMGGFYAYLADGHSKSEALQLAQLDYLREQKEERLAHPYYWASFVLIGDEQPLSSDRNTRYALWAALLLALLGLLAVKRFRSQ